MTPAPAAAEEEAACALHRPRQLLQHPPGLVRQRELPAGGQVPPLVVPRGQVVDGHENRQHDDGAGFVGLADVGPDVGEQRGATDAEQQRGVWFAEMFTDHPQHSVGDQEFAAEFKNHE